MKDELKVGAPAGTLFKAHPSGWMQADLFVEWFRHFLLHTKPTHDDPVLLILDGHVSHTKNLEFIDLARENHVTVVSLPPHCTHRLQPLDVAFMGPLKLHYSRAIEKFHRETKGQPVKQNNISALFAEAYGKTAKQATAENGFRRTGLYPLDEGVFSDEDFAHSDLSTEHAVSGQALEAQVRWRHNSIQLEQDLIGFEESPKPDFSKYNPKEQDNKSSISDTTVGFRTSMPVESTTHRNNYPKLETFPNDIMPLPRPTVQFDAPKRGRAAEKAAVLTSDDFTNDLRIKKLKLEKENQPGKSSMPTTDQYSKTVTCSKKAAGEKKTKKAPLKPVARLLRQ